jgi:putative phosphoribosyl transferase
MFADRRDAGAQLAEVLTKHAAAKPIVVGLPRGGVPVAAQVASRLGAPLDVVVVRKLGCPWQPELGIGALAEGGVRVLNEVLIDELGIGRDDLDAVIAREQAEVDRRVRRYRQGRAPIPLTDRVVILVDDGLATGYTARAAIESMRRRGANRVILAVPVASKDSAANLREAADEVVVLSTPPWLFAIGEFYEDFSQTTDEEVMDLLDRHAGPSASSRRMSTTTAGR